jgi:hypothetical protein
MMTSKKNGWNKIGALAFAGILTASQFGTAFAATADGALNTTNDADGSNASPEVTETYRKCWDIWHDSDGEEHISKPNAFYFTLADLLLYIKEYPIVKDYDTMETIWTEDGDTKWEDVPEQTMPNPMSGVATRMINYMEFVDNFWNAFGLKSELRIIGWIL